MQAISSQRLSFAKINPISTAARRAVSSLRHSLASAVGRDCEASAPTFEPLESRQLMSVSGIPMFNSSHPLGNLTTRNHPTVRGVVGGSVADIVYSFNATAPMTLNLTLAGLQQSDTAEVLFPDGQVIASQASVRSSMKMTTPLNAGQYEVEVTTHEVKGEMAARRPRISPLVRDFTLQLRATKYIGGAPTQQTDDGGDIAVLGAAGGTEEPITETIGDGMIATTYADVPNTSLFGNTGQPSPDDVVQGVAGDCWFLSTLSVIARTDPGLIEQDIVSLGNDQYKVRFYQTVDNAPQADWITIDGELPETSNGDLPFAQVPTDGSLWVPLMEKAFCYFRDQGTTPNYENTESGLGDEALGDFGATSVSEAGTSLAGNYGYAVTSTNGTQLEAQISQWLSAGDVAVVDTIPDSSTGQSYTTTLVGAHQYSVVGVTDAGIELRNPWGNNPVSLSNLDVVKSPSDGGYITVTPTQLYNDTAMAFGGLMPQVTINPTPTPSPSPSPAPTPSPTVQQASATGIVFNDLNNDSQLDQGDPGISGIMVYATTTQGGAYDPSDPSAISDSNGNFTITGLTAGTTYWFYEQAPSGQTVTAGSDGWYSTPTAGQTITGIQFGNVQNAPSTQTASATGIVFNDLNNDASLDQGDPGISGVVVYATTTESATYQSGDPSAVSDSNGNFTISGLTAGQTWYFYELVPNGDSLSDGAYGWNATPTPGQTITGVQFGNIVSTPTPISSGTTLNVQQSSQYSDLTNIYGTWGNNSVQLQDGTVADVYAFTATTTGGTLVGLNTANSGASPEIEVVDFSADGSVVNVSSAGASGASNAFCEFSITAGDQYEVLVASATNAGGDYDLAFVNTAMSSPEQLAPAWFTNGGSSNIITPAGVAPSTGTVFASLPIAFGAAPQPNVQNSGAQVINSVMGPQSYVTTDGALIDEYSMIATTSSYTTISTSSSVAGFTPDIYVVEYAGNGVETNSWHQGPQSNGNGTASIGFNVQAGYTYQVFICSTTGASGNYQVAYQGSVFNSVQQINMTA